MLIFFCQKTIFISQTRNIKDVSRYLHCFLYLSQIKHIYK